MMFSLKEQNKYAFEKDKFISVSIELPKKKVEHKRKKSASLAASKAPAKTVSPDVDVNELFSDVWTQKISHKKKKKRDLKRLKDISKKLKTSELNRVDPLAKKIETLEEKASAENEQQRSTANEVNEYLAKIQAIVYQHFSVPPNSEGNSVKTVIELDPLGKMIDFRILNYSANEALNKEADKIKERLRNVVFPKNPQNRSSRTIVVLISKE